MLRLVARGPAPPTRPTTSGRSGSSSSSTRPGWPYREKAPVNWCPSCKTVLADEQVIDGVCERCGTRGRAARARAVVLPHHRATRSGCSTTSTGSTGRRRRRPPSATGSAAARAPSSDFPVRAAGDDADARSSRPGPTRVFGVTYMVLAPEHPLVDRARDRRAARRGRAPTARTPRAVKDVDRVDADAREDRRLHRRHAINPANGERVPIWIADYVLIELRHRRDHGRARRTTSATSSSPTKFGLDDPRGDRAAGRRR